MEQNNRENRYCECGCGNHLRYGFKYLIGHAPSKHLCACGCGSKTTNPNNRYLKGHNHSNDIDVRIPKDELYNKYIVDGDKDEDIAKYFKCTRKRIHQALKLYNIKERGIRDTYRKICKQKALLRGKVVFCNPYTKSFNKQMKDFIRMRDGYTCQLCGKTELENEHKLTCHHIDYDKTNSFPINLIALCIPCHGITNGRKNRKYWTLFFTNLLNLRQHNSKAYKPNSKNRDKVRAKSLVGG